MNTNDRKLGTLYRRVLSLNTVYDFYDNQNQAISTAQSHFFSYGYHLDVFDTNKEMLGSVEEKIFNWFPSFEIFSADGVSLANASMNFWGTKFTLYDGRSDRVLAEMSRPFFRMRNFWTIDIKNMSRIQERKLDPRLLLTVLAVQGDIENLERYRRNQELDRFNRNRNDTNNQNRFPHTRRLSVENKFFDKVQTLRNKYADFLKKEEELADVALPNDKKLNEIALQLDKDFQQLYAGASMLEENRSEQFIEYCVNVAQSSDTSPDMQKAILHLVSKRLFDQAKISERQKQ